MEAHPLHAMIRFGLGRRGEEPLPDDPVTWLTDQVRAPDPMAPDTTLPNTADALTLLREQFKLRLKGGNALIRPLYDTEVEAYANQVLTTAAPFRERLVAFWANHFSVSTRQFGLGALAGPFVREAIRPHVTGQFSEMLVAVMRHPAMLYYLDNQASVGPNSPAARNQPRRGLNENLARECLELHTVTQAAGYTQADVTSFARVISGWSIEFQRLFPGYQFREGAHEPGDQIVLGRRFGPGEAGGIAALEFLARHPMTHRNLATKLVRHFVADDPPPEAVRVIEGVLRDTEGDLQEASLALLRLPQAWTPLAKLRTPQDFAVAALRALDLPAEKRPPFEGGLNTLGQPVWGAPLPNGWADNAAEWSSPEAVMRRIDWAYALAGRAGDAEPARVMEASLGTLLTQATSDAVRHAGSRRDALTLLFTSPEFQRR